MVKILQKKTKKELTKEILDRFLMEHSSSMSIESMSREELIELALNIYWANAY